MRENAKQRALFDFLRDCEEAGRLFKISEASEATALKPSSVTTYISKKLNGVWVERRDAEGFAVHGLRAVTFEQFQAALSQTTGASFSNYHEWRLVLRSLLEHGLHQRFPVEETLRQILASCEATRPPAARPKNAERSATGKRET